MGCGLCAGDPEINGALYPDGGRGIAGAVGNVLHPLQIEGTIGGYCNTCNAGTGAGTDDGCSTGGGAVANRQSEEGNVRAGRDVYAARDKHMIAHLHVTHTARTIAARRGTLGEGHIIPCGFAGSTLRKKHPGIGIGRDYAGRSSKRNVAVAFIGNDVQSCIGSGCIVCTTGIQANLAESVVCHLNFLLDVILLG